MAQNNNQAVLALRQYASQGAVAQRIQESVKDSKHFLSTLSEMVMGTYMLQKCTPESIVKAAVIAADIGLSINPAIAQAYVVPYGNEAKFSVGYKGLIQLAQSTGMYSTINATPVYQDEITNFNPLTSEFSFKDGFNLEGERFTGGTPVGYYAHFELKNGFKSAVFMTKKQIEDFALQYSKAYQSDKKSGKSNSPWSTNFDAMAIKTVLRQLIDKYGPKNHRLETAMASDSDTPKHDKPKPQAAEAKHVAAIDDDIPEAEVVEGDDKTEATPGY